MKVAWVEFCTSNLGLDSLGHGRSLSSMKPTQAQCSVTRRRPKSKLQSVATRVAKLLLPLVLTVPVVVNAQFAYTTNDGTITITGYPGSGGNVIIPETIDGLPVTSIGFWAFSDCNLTNITIPDSVINIGSYAFYGCSDLTNVTIGTSVISIGSSAFSTCYSLTSITIPDSVTSIEGYAFYGCTGLTRITVRALNAFYSSVDGVLFNKPQTTLIQYPGSKVGRYTIPDSVTSIGDYAFDGCGGLTSVTLSNSVTSIGSSAFSSCYGLTSITIPDSVTNIGSAAFYYCSGLTNVTLGNRVTSIGDSAFSGCTSLTSITANALNVLYSSVNGVLFNKNQTTLILYPKGKVGSYTIPVSVTSIGGSTYYKTEGAFAGCTNLTSVTIGNGVTSIGDYAFDGCNSLTIVAIPTSVTNIGKDAFADCTSLTALTVNPENRVYSDLDGVLFDQRLNRLIQFPGGLSISYTIPGSVTNIRSGAFAGCTSLASVTIPGSVASIDGGYYGGCGVFQGCASLTNVTIGNGVTSIDGGMSGGGGCVPRLHKPDQRYYSQQRH